MAKLTYVKGDILTPNTGSGGVLVCHQVNCQGVMGAGLAKQVKHLHPGVYACYKDKCRLIKTGVGGLGDVQFCSALESYGYIVANIFGQYDYGKDRQQTDYAALHKAFTCIAQTFPADTVRIPYKMGCGMGGGEWPVVLKIIEETLVANNVRVEIWQLFGAWRKK